jgi:hypothetical protein
MAFDFIGGIVVRVGFEVVAYGTGRLVIPALSLGTARGDKFSTRRYLQSSRLWWREGKQLVFAGDTTAVLGIVFWIAVCVAAYQLLN